MTQESHLGAHYCSFRGKTDWAKCIAAQQKEERAQRALYHFKALEDMYVRKERRLSTETAQIIIELLNEKRISLSTALELFGVTEGAPLP